MSLTDRRFRAGGLGNAVVKAEARLKEGDPVLGVKCLTTMKEMAEAPNLHKRMDTYKKIDDYIEDRIHDIGWS
jgi:hypothetical protein